MNTPLIILKNKLPVDLINLIQTYMTNDIVTKAVSKYFDKLYQKKDEYDDFVWDNYVFPNCQCNNCPENGLHKLFKRKDCNVCFMFESSLWYYNTFYECTLNNLQYFKIVYGRKNYSDEEVDDYIQPFHFYYNKVDDDIENLENRNDYTVDRINFNIDY